MTATDSWFLSSPAHWFLPNPFSSLVTVSTLSTKLIGSQYRLCGSYTRIKYLKNISQTQARQIIGNRSRSFPILVDIMKAFYREDMAMKEACCPVDDDCIWLGFKLA